MFKWLCVVGLLIAFVTACSMPYDYYFDHSESFSSIKEVCEWICLNIEYEEDVNNEWQLPHETYERGKGDCEDTTLLAMYFVHEMGYDPVFVEVRFYATGQYHAMFGVNEYLYDSCFGQVCYFCEVIRVYDYTKALAKAEKR